MLKTVEGVCGYYSSHNGTCGALSYEPGKGVLETPSLTRDGLGLATLISPPFCRAKLLKTGEVVTEQRSCTRYSEGEPTALEELEITPEDEVGGSNWDPQQLTEKLALRALNLFGPERVGSLRNDLRKALFPEDPGVPIPELE